MEEMIHQHTLLEYFIAQLEIWLTDSLDNDNISDGLYGYVKDMVMETKKEREELEDQIARKAGIY